MGRWDITAKKNYEKVILNYFSYERNVFTFLRKRFH